MGVGSSGGLAELLAFIVLMVYFISFIIWIRIKIDSRNNFECDHPMRKLDGEIK